MDEYIDVEEVAAFLPAIPSDYYSLTWDIDYDDSDNELFEAASTVYTYDSDGGLLYYRVRPSMIGSRVIWMVDESDRELVVDVYDHWLSAKEAQEWCESQNREAFDSARLSLL